MGYALKRYAIKWVILCCHLKAARRDATANLKCFGAGDTSDLISVVSFTFDMRCRIIRLASAPFTSFHLAKFEIYLQTSMCKT